VTVAESRSDAVWSRSGSQGSGESTAARAVLAGGRLSLVVLHSQGSSQGAGSVSLLALNGVDIAPSQGAEGGSGLTDPIAHLTVLQTDRSGAVVGKVDDGRAQRVVSVGTTWMDNPSTDPQPLR
jgi:hypothetical protein